MATLRHGGAAHGATAEPTRNEMGEEEIRDRLQPHWRALHDAAAAAEADLRDAEAGQRQARLFARFGRARRTLRAARQAFEEAIRAKEAVDMLWNGEAMRRQTDVHRTGVQAASRRGGTIEADRAAALAEAERKLADLREHRAQIELALKAGQTVVRVPQGQNPAQALRRLVEEVTAAAGEAT